ncbi:MAG: hypothetical protein RR588_03625, partial [Solibacillus sp.]
MKKQFMTFCAVILLATQAPVANAEGAAEKSPEFPKRGYSNYQLVTNNPYEVVQLNYKKMMGLEDSSKATFSYYGLKIHFPIVNWGQIVKPGEKPNWNTILKPGEKPNWKPVIKPEWKPVIKPDWKPEWKPEDKPVEKPIEKPEDKPVEKPIEKPEDKPVEKPIEKP